MDNSKLHDEPGRQAALDRLAVLDTAPEAPFDKITQLVRTVIGVPIAAVSLIDRDRQFFKSIQGLDTRGTPRNQAFCDHTIRRSEPMVVPDASADPRFWANPLVTAAPRIGSYAGVPLRSPDGYQIGALCAIDTAPHNFTEHQITLLGSFAALVEDELQLRTLADRDHLTGALTRRALIDQATGLIELNRRHARPASLIILDVDHFKRVNDTYGHPAGDAVLVALARTVRTVLRLNDRFGRLGGEEFAVLLPETPLGDALVAAERLRHGTAIAPPAFVGGPQVTVSLGVSSLGLPETDGWEGWLAAADAALYAAKRSGRNRVEAARGAAQSAA